MKKLAPLLLLTTLLAIGGFYFFRGSETNGLTKVEGYNENAVCDAMSPGCGLCYGEIIDHQCYIDKSKLTDEELSYMGY